MKYTVGNEWECKCPTCGEMMNMWDLISDLCVKIGSEHECPHCDSKFMILDIHLTAKVVCVPAIFTLREIKELVKRRKRRKGEQIV